MTLIHPSRKAVLLAALATFFVASACADTFDLATYTAPPKPWKQKTNEDAVLFSNANDAKDTFCLITLFKSGPATKDSKKNFDSAWAVVARDMVKMTAPPKMATPGTEDGWEAQIGMAPFEKDGLTGTAMLINMSGYGKMVSVLVLSNTNEYEQDISNFLSSLHLTKP